MAEEKALITYQIGSISFPQYEEYLDRAKEVADVLNGITLTEDNVKEVKGKLADARKIVDALKDRRIEVKKALLTPYETLEAQIKIISGIINDADTVLRDKVRELEEQERQEKKAELYLLWIKRVPDYLFPAYVEDAFNRWLTPQHLNKTTSLSKAEKDMVSWMEQREQDCKTILSLPNKTQIMIAYNTCLELSVAINEGTKQAEQEQEITSKTNDGGNAEVAWFEVTGDTAINFAEYLFKSNDIDYRRVK